jgi:cold shock CspA family protein
VQARGLNLISSRSSSRKDVFVHVSAVEKAGLSNLNGARLSNTRKSQIEERHRLKISKCNADFSERARYALSLANSCLSAAFPALLAAAMV